MSVPKDAAKAATSVLVVEDSPAQAESLRFALERSDYGVTLARNGRQALGSFDGCGPAVVLSDIMMPEVDGYEPCTCNKTDPDTQRTGRNFTNLSLDLGGLKQVNDARGSRGRR